MFDFLAVARGAIQFVTQNHIYNVNVMLELLELKYSIVMQCMFLQDTCRLTPCLVYLIHPFSHVNYCLKMKPDKIAIAKQ